MYCHYEIFCIEIWPAAGENYREYSWNLGKVQSIINDDTFMTTRSVSIYDEANTTEQHFSKMPSTHLL